MTHKKPYTVVIIQARMGSSRLPEKVMRNVLGRPLLSYLLERVHRSGLADAIVVATTTDPRDDQIVDLCKKEGVSFFRGEEHDVLDRYYQAAKAYGAEVVVRLTGDNPFVDPLLIDGMLRTFYSHYPKYDYLSNVIERTYPRGLDVEILTMHSLETMKLYATSPEELEHVTTYVLNHPDRFKIYSVTEEKNLSHLRWTVDTEEDFTLARCILEELYPKNALFSTEDILALLEEHPDWKNINAHIKQKAN